MTDQELEFMIVQMSATLSGLKQVVATLAARAAAEYEDPENFIISLCAPLETDAATSDPTENLIAQALTDLGDEIEQAALRLL